MAPAQILVIDDTPETIRSLTAAIGRQGWRVVISTRGREGFWRAQLLLPSLILLDVRMPDMSGFAVSRLLREERSTAHIPIIFLTSSGELDDRIEGLTHGGVDYVMKTCDPAELVARIQIHLELAPRTTQTDEEETLPPPHADDATLRAAMRMIREHLGEPLSTETIAQKVGTHEKRLSAIFREHLGMTVFAWIRDERLLRSRQLLADTRLPIQVIAEDIGFRGAGNFATAFRERFGVTPMQFRQRGGA